MVIRLMKKIFLIALLALSNCSPAPLRPVKVYVSLPQSGGLVRKGPLETYSELVPYHESKYFRCVDRTDWQLLLYRYQIGSDPSSP